MDSLLIDARLCLLVRFSFHSDLPLLAQFDQWSKPRQHRFRKRNRFSDRASARGACSSSGTMLPGLHWSTRWFGDHWNVFGSMFRQSSIQPRIFDQLNFLLEWDEAMLLVECQGTWMIKCTCVQPTERESTCAFAQACFV